jgi:hypothetical protein
MVKTASTTHVQFLVPGTETRLEMASVTKVVVDVGS